MTSYDTQEGHFPIILPGMTGREHLYDLMSYEKLEVSVIWI